MVLSGMRSKLFASAVSVCQTQTRASLHTQASRWAKKPENFQSVLSWFAQVENSFSVNLLEMQISTHSIGRLTWFCTEPGHRRAADTDCGGGPVGNAGI